MSRKKRFRRAVASPSISIATLAQKLQQVYLEQTLADVEQDIATADWLQAVDANELTGMSVYLPLPELEIDSWATLAGVGPARSEIPEPEKIDPASHRLLKLMAEREDGSRIL